jgi:uncharacterized membrane protein
MEERRMKKKTLIALITVLIVGIAVCSVAYAFHGPGPRGRGYKARDVLSQLPEEKEMLFHRTMREAREETADLREQIAQLHEEIRDIFTAPEFDKALFSKKMKQVHALQEKMHTAREQAILELATQFTQEERKLLADMITPGFDRRGKRFAR